MFGFPTRIYPGRVSCMLFDEKNSEAGGAFQLCCPAQSLTQRLFLFPINNDIHKQDYNEPCGTAKYHSCATENFITYLLHDAIEACIVRSRKSTTSSFRVALIVSHVLISALFLVKNSSPSENQSSRGTLKNPFARRKCS